MTSLFPAASFACVSHRGGRGGGGGPAPIATMVYKGRLSFLKFSKLYDAKQSTIKQEKALKRQNINNNNNNNNNNRR